jgi:hypothetical protein
MKKTLIGVIAMSGILLVTGVASGHGYGGFGFGVFFALPIIIAPAPVYPYPCSYPYTNRYYPPPPDARPDYYGDRVWIPGRWEEQWGPYGWERVWIPGYWRYYP